jgi:hypothetical protein
VNATRITFENLTPGQQSNVVIQGNYQFVGSNGAFPLPANFGVSTNTGSNALVAPGIGAGDGATLSRFDGGVFNIYLADVFNTQPNITSPFNVFFRTVDALGNPSSFTVTHTVQGLTIANTGQTFDFGAQGLGHNLRSFSWSNAAWPLAFDNIVVSSPADTPAVPEPATWALMLVGFGLTGAALRRRAKMAVQFG